jgi:hypothetical protein
MGLVTASSSAARLRTGASTPPGAAGTPSPARTKCQRRRNGQERASRGRNGRQNAAGPSPSDDSGRLVQTPTKANSSGGERVAALLVRHY